MKTFVSAILILCFAAIVVSCSEKAEENLVPSVVTNYEAPVKTAAVAASEATLAAEPAEEASPNLDEVAPESESAATSLGLERSHLHNDKKMKTFGLARPNSLNSANPLVISCSYRSGIR